MSEESIREHVLRQFCSMLDVTEHADGSFGLSTPFLFPDGDGYPIVLERVNGGWRFTDRGATVGHLFFDDVDLSDYRVNFLRRAARGDGVGLSKDFVLSTEAFDALPTPLDLADFIQSIARIGGVTALERQTSESYIKAIRSRVVDRVAYPSTEDWHAPQDNARLYPADLQVIGPRPEPVVMFFVASDGKALSSTVSLQQYHEWSLNVSALVAVRPKSISSPNMAKLQNAIGRDSAVTELEADEQGYRTLNRVLSESGLSPN